MLLLPLLQGDPQQLQPGAVGVGAEAAAAVCLAAGRLAEAALVAVPVAAAVATAQQVVAGLLLSVKFELLLALLPGVPEKAGRQQAREQWVWMLAAQHLVEPAG